MSHVTWLGHDALVSGIAEHGLRLPYLAALADFGPLPRHAVTCVADAPECRQMPP
ncbi:hypothetical protein [Streptomyces atratus]|uniref:hypothetical protein n=1 Tax=Streptomyces atratus TaxID=1893 RepID=UPI0036667395